jgi:anaerobic ribonucleoside-triphosphate reductase activating protein
MAANAELLQVHDVLPASRANGPGVRFVVWVQGCSRRCPGCFNPATHDPAGGRSVPVAELAVHVASLGHAIEGITLSGGEPLEQPEAVLALLCRVRRETDRSSLLFTGLTWEEFRALPEAGPIAGCLDLLIAGPYDASRRCACDVRGSENQTVHFLSDRYQARDLAGAPASEVVITPEGSIITTGIDPLGWAAGRRNADGVRGTA